MKVLKKVCIVSLYPMDILYNSVFFFKTLTTYSQGTCETKTHCQFILILIVCFMNITCIQGSAIHSSQKLQIQMVLSGNHVE